MGPEGLRKDHGDPRGQPTLWKGLVRAGAAAVGHRKWGLGRRSCVSRGLDALVPVDWGGQSFGPREGSKALQSPSGPSLSFCVEGNVPQLHRLRTWTGDREGSDVETEADLQRGFR